MSEPCSFTALIHMTPEAFAALMRSKTLDPLADAIVRIVTNGLNDVVVFKYLKKDEALFAHCYFHYEEPLEALLEAPGIAAILAASAFKDMDTVDRAVISHDANNFTQSEPSAGFVIRRGAVDRDDSFDAPAIAAFDRLQDQHFFKLAETFGDGGHWIHNRRVLDTKLRRKVQRKLEARQRLIAKERIPTATALRPVRLFDKYHYNGRFMLWSGRSPILPLPQIDPHTVRQTAYGAADADHVVVDGVVLRTNPAKFKALRNDNTTYFVGPDAVYDAKMIPVAQADPKTFALVHGTFARDKERWWYTYRGEQLEDVGDAARIDDSLYFATLVLLLGDRSVYLGDRRLPVHAPSCRVVRTKPLRRDPFYGGLIWLADDEGDSIISCVGRYGQEVRLDVRRTAQPDAAWSDAEAAWEALVEGELPMDVLGRETKKAQAGEVEASAFITFFEDWVSQHMEAHWREDPYNSFVWEGTERYFEMLLRQGAHEKLLDFYDKVGAEAWFHPPIFLHTALAYLALGQPEEAITEMRYAAVYSYSAASTLFEHPQIAPLLERDDVGDLQAFAAFLRSRPGKGPPLPGELARHWLEAIPDRHKVKATQRFFTHFHIPNRAFLDSVRAVDAERAALYERSLAAFINACMLDPSTRHYIAYDARRNYRIWGDLEGLHPAVHLIAASSLFAEGFFWIDMKAEDMPHAEFERAVAALGRAKQLAAQTPWEDDPDWQKIAADPAYGPLLDLVDAPPRSPAAD